jgi:RNA polymerase sigma-70 factor (ECF subfamily)
VLRPLQGADRLARLYMQIGTRFYSRPDVRFTIATLNGEPVLLAWLDDTLVSATWFECEGDRITATLALRHPAKLARLSAVTNDAPLASLH